MIEKNPELAAQACEVISDFYLQQGNGELAETFSDRAAEYFAKAVELNQKALTFSASDKFESHDLDPTRLEKLKAQLQKIRGLNAAFLIRKLVEGSDPMYVLAVMAAPTFRDGQSVLDIDQLFDDLTTNVELPSPVVLISLDGERAYLMNPIANVPGAQIFATPEAGLVYRH